MIQPVALVIVAIGQKVIVVRMNVPTYSDFIPEHAHHKDATKKENVKKTQPVEEDHRHQAALIGNGRKFRRLSFRG
jgi:hypothetical protein